MANFFSKAIEKVKTLLRRLKKRTNGDEPSMFPINKRWEKRIKEWKARFGDRGPDSGELLQYLEDHKSEISTEISKLNTKYLGTVLDCLDWGEEGPSAARFTIGDQTVFIG
jgi:hypothetical protein